MNKIELFAGSGGGILAGKLQGHKTVAAVELLDYNRTVLKARTEADIHVDVTKFNGRPYKGVDLICGGFPCTDVSAAGKGEGIDGLKSRLVWDMLRICEEAAPEYIFAENSDRLRVKGLRRILLKLMEMGYCLISWQILAASQVGAPHLRKRMWLLAAKGGRPAELPKDMPFAGTIADGLLHDEGKTILRPASMPTLISSDARHSGNRPGKSEWSLSDVLGITAKFQKAGITMPTVVASDYKGHAGAGTQRLLGLRSRPLRDVLPLIEGGTCINPDWAEWYMGWPVGWTDLDWEPDLGWWKTRTLNGNWWTDKVEEEFLPRTLDKRPGKYQDRIFALGNGQVPLCAAAAFQTLMARVK
jgi:hypothetical protein